MSTNSLSQIVPVRALTIAGSDSGGSAGVQADLKTFAAWGVYGTSALTVVTAQNTLGVKASFPLSPHFIQAQIEAVLGDIGAQAIKCGLLGRAEVVEAVAESLQGYSAPLILDPVLVDRRGALIVKPQTIEAYRRLLMPYARVITPNLDEAQHLTGQTGQDEKAIRAMLEALHRMGAQMVIIKGGHVAHGEAVLDWVFDGQRLETLHAPRLPLENPHGVGCTLAAAITAGLAQGKDRWTAVYQAHSYLHKALQAALGWQVGAGRSPVNHHLGQAVYQP